MEEEEPVTNLARLVLRFLASYQTWVFFLAFFLIFVWLIKFSTSAFLSIDSLSNPKQPSPYTLYA